MKLSDGEKLIIVMLADIQKHLGFRGEVDPELVKSAIYNNSLFGLEWEYSFLFSGEEKSEAVVTEVVDVLDMWSFLEGAYKLLGAPDKARIAAEVPYYGKEVVFPGFDGNNEGEHFGTAKFLVDDMGRWSEFKGREMNSHSESLSGHRSMLSVFMPMRKTIKMGAMSADQIIGVLNSRHP